MKTRVLITGSNGFLGTHICRNLILNPEIEIIAMVRAPDNKSALKRLQRAWYDWDELSQLLKDHNSLNEDKNPLNDLKSDKSRVKVLSGDVTQENLGLSDDDYQILTSTLTHIIHTVADLRLHIPLEELNQTNLNGTNNLLKLAHQAISKGKFQRFSHISTAYVAGKQQGTILEDEFNDENISGEHGFWSNYEKSKAEAEKAVSNSKIPYSIFRPGMVVGDSKTGEIKTFNTVYALLKLYLTGKLRFIPSSSSLKLNMIPVDYVAQAVASLNFDLRAEGKTFHLTPPPESLPTISQLLDQVRVWALEELNIELSKPIFIPMAPLIQRISSIAPNKKSGILNILFTLAPYLNEKHQFVRENVDNLFGTYELKWEEYLPNLLKFATYHGFFHRSERTVHEQVLLRLKSRSYPVKYYDIINGKIQEKSSIKIREDILAALQSLKQMGVQKGDQVALVGLNSTRYLTLEVAIGLLGAVSVPLYYTSPPVEIKNVLKVSKANILFIGTPHLMKRLNELDMDLKMVSFCRESQKIPNNITSWHQFLKRGRDTLNTTPSRIQSPVNFTDLATIRYTSGTTGKPKGVTFQHAQLRWMAESMASLPPWKDRNREVRYLSFLPMNHVVEGILGTFSPYYAPAPLKVYFLEDFNDLAMSLPKIKPTIFFSVPRFYEKLWSRLKETFFGSHYLHLKSGKLKNLLKPIIRIIFQYNAGLNHCSQLIVGSATSSQQLIHDYHEMGIDVHNAYGLTEAPLVTLNRRGNNQIGTVGEPLPETEIKIAKDGEVMVKGPQVTPGYFEKDLDPPKEDNWLLTGDLGFVTSEGSLVITGRKKELIINSYGKSIDPLRIEALLRDIPGVEEVMLVGEGKPYLSGLFWVNEDHDPDKISQDINQINRSLSRPEQIKIWALLSNDLSIDGGDLTANMKLKREIITRRYNEVIDSIYHDKPNPLILHLGHLEEQHGT